MCLCRHLSFRAVRGKGFLLALRRKVDLFTSVPILTETTRILRTKFDRLNEISWRH